MTADTKKPDLGRIGENAFTEVLRVFLSLPVTVRNSSTHGHDSSTRDPIISTVRLAGPRVSGSVEVQLPLAFVAHAFRRLTGFESDARDATAALEDTAGELANMVAGRVAAQLAAEGFPCTLGTPSVSRSGDSPVETEAGVQHGRADFFCEGHALSIKLRYRFVDL